MSFYDRNLGFRDGTYVVTIKPYGRYVKSPPQLRKNEELLCWEYRYTILAGGATRTYWFPEHERHIADRGKAIMVKKGSKLEFY